MNLQQGVLTDSLLGKIAAISSNSRRSILNDKMKSLITEQFDCFKCPGHCCTYEHNSMRVSPLEAYDTFIYLQKNYRITPELVQSLEANIKQYRLDKEILMGRGQELRRYYTCPFYKEESLGCTIGKHHKPYGCLAFNPYDKAVSKAGHCHSYQETLESREQANQDSELEINEGLKKELNLYWDKKDLPSAVLILIKSFYSF